MTDASLGPEPSRTASTLQSLAKEHTRLCSCTWSGSLHGSLVARLRSNSTFSTQAPPSSAERVIFHRLPINSKLRRRQPHRVSHLCATALVSASPEQAPCQASSPAGGQSRPEVPKESQESCGTTDPPAPQVNEWLLNLGQPLQVVVGENHLQALGKQFC